MENYFEFEGFNDDLLIGNEEQSSFAIDPFGNEEEEESNVVGAIATAVGQVAEAGGKIAEAEATKKTAEAKLAEIGGKRSALLKACEDNKAYKKFLDQKYRRNRINDCQADVNKRMTIEEKKNEEIVNRQTAILERETAIAEGKAVGDIQTRKATIESEALKTKTTLAEKKSGKKLYVFGGIASLLLVLGVVVYLKSKNN
jgi:hypothetical protein